MRNEKKKQIRNGWLHPYGDELSPFTIFTDFASTTSTATMFWSIQNLYNNADIYIFLHIDIS